MQNNSTPQSILLYPTPIIDELELDRGSYIYLQSQLDYMASRLRAALQSFANRQKNLDNERWWLEGFQYEMVRYGNCSSAKFRLIQESCPDCYPCSCWQRLNHQYIFGYPPPYTWPTEQFSLRRNQCNKGHFER